MRYLLVAIVLGLLVGFVLGGRLRELGRHTFRLWPVLFLGLALQVVVEAVDAYGMALYLASYLCLLGFCLANVRLRGMTVVAIGIALNAAVVSANGGMPVRPEALRAAGLAGDELPAIRDSKHHYEDGDTRLALLGDVIPVPQLGEVVSYGDLVQAVGLADVLVHLMRPRRRRRVREEAPAEVDEAVLDEALAPYAVSHVIDLAAEERRAVETPA